MSDIEPRESDPDSALAAILRILLERTGTDFSTYRPCTVERRVRNRMIVAGADTFEQYLDKLRRDSAEAVRLLERVTIKVSRFYRNRITFDWLRAEVIPGLAAAASGRPLGIWSAGCGFGEEAYTLGMLLDEANVPGYVVATDIDPGALDRAVEGRYPRSAFIELPKELLARYVEPGEKSCRVDERARSRVRFARHDILSHCPPPGGSALFDLVCCRNVLIYLARGVQEKVLHTLRRRVRTGGFLCLGEAEWPPPSVAASLEALPHKTHLFRAVEHSLPCVP